MLVHEEMSSVHRLLIHVLVLFLVSTASAQTTDGPTGDESTTLESTSSNRTTLTRETTSRRDEGPVTSTQNDSWKESTNSTQERTSPASDNSASERTASGIPEVTATSQRIVLLTTGLSEDTKPGERRENNTTAVEESTRTTKVEADTTIKSTDSVSTHSTIAVTVASPTTTTVSETKISDSGTRVPTTMTPDRADPTRTSVHEDVTAGVNGTVQEAAGTEGNDTDGHLALLTFNGTCGYDLPSIVDQLKALPTANITPVGLYRVSCRREVRLWVPVSDAVVLQSLVGVFRLQIRDSALTLSAVEFFDKRSPEDEDFVPRIFAGPFSTREIITYAVVGGVFGVAIVLVAALLCCKCCCAGSRQRKKSEDIPHLTLRLEDYSLTRIPRPNTLFFSGEGCGGAVRNGVMSSDGAARVRQSVETSVVPIEEDFGSLRRGELRSFSGRSRFRNRAAPQLQQRDQEDTHSRCSPALTGSTERLARDFGNRQGKRGNENKNFRF